MKIGDLARATGTKVETIRYYESEGLIPQPARSAANYRLYEQPHLDRLSFIRRSRDLGFTLDQVRTLLQLADDRRRDCAMIDTIATENLREVDRKIADLTALRRELASVIASCQGGSVSECRILEALAPSDEVVNAVA